MGTPAVSDGWAARCWLSVTSLASAEFGALGMRATAATLIAAIMNFLFAAALRGILIVVAITGAMALFRKVFPASRKALTGQELDIEALDERFTPLRSKVISAMILIGLIFGLGSYFALIGINRALAALDGQGQFRFFPESAIWWFFPGFGAICLSWEFTLQLWALFAGQDLVNLFSDWTNNSTAFWGRGSYTGMDSRKVLRWMAVLIVLPIGIFTALALNMHTVIGPDGIRECGYAFKPCTVHSYASMRRVTKVRGRKNDKGQFIPESSIVIDYSDGKRWSSADWSGARDSLDLAPIQFLANQALLEIGSVSTKDQIAPLPPNK
jgi:hypothetical protein